MGMSQKKVRGFSTIGAVVALVMLGTMATGLAALIALSHKGRTMQAYSNQSFYVNQAALEFAMRNIKALNNSSVPSRQFLGTSLGISSGAKISSAVSYGSGSESASNTFSITNPGTGGLGCVYVLAPSGSSALSITGSGLVSSPCSVYVNSSSNTAVQIVGSGIINSVNTNIVGGYSIVGTGQILGTINTGAPSKADPLASYNIPSYSACNFNNTTILSNTTLNPGVYCNGINIVGSPTVTMNPGNYIIDGGSFSVTGLANITGNGVTIFLSKQLQSSWATFNLTMSGGSLNLRAPTAGQFSGALAGISIFQSRSATSGSNSIVGTTNLNIEGAVYFPNQTLTFVGGSSANAPCTMLVANKLNITGSANISCASGDLSGLIQ